MFPGQAGRCMRVHELTQQTPSRRKHVSRPVLYGFGEHEDQELGQTGQL
jgi:hypothetical protein